MIDFVFPDFDLDLDGEPQESHVTELPYCEPQESHVTELPYGETGYHVENGEIENDIFPYKVEQEEQLHFDSPLSPIDETQMSSLRHRVGSPIGQYVIKNTDYGLFDSAPIESEIRIDIPYDFSQSDIQFACDNICDSLNWDRLPVTLTDAVPNAEFHPGFFRRRSFDDSLYLNPEYAHNCVKHLESTDIIVSDLAHEIGHSMAMSICGDLGITMNEEMADFISGFANAKNGVDIDVARKWFEWYYDPDGVGGYPVSEDRWNAEAAGYYFGKLVDAEDLHRALRDPNFPDIVKAYKHDKDQLIEEFAFSNHDSSSPIEKNPHFGSLLLERITNFSDRYNLGPQIARLTRDFFKRI